MENTRQYELAVVIHPDLEIDLGPTRTKLEKLVGGLGGKLKSGDEWGKHKLAYPINRQEFGIYHFYQLELEPAKTAELEHALGLNDEILRHLLVKPLEFEPTPPKATSKAKPATAAKPPKKLAGSKPKTIKLAAKASSVNNKAKTTKAKEK